MRDRRKTAKLVGMDIGDITATITRTEQYPQELLEEPAENFWTAVLFAVPLEPTEFKEGQGEIDWRDGRCLVRLEQVLSKERDPLASLPVMLDLRTPSAGHVVVPPEASTDHQCSYPYVLATVFFPTRLPGLLPSEATNTPILHGHMDAIPPPNRNKIEALEVLNRKLKDPSYGLVVAPIGEDDVTMFVEAYGRKESSEWLLRRVHHYSSPSAFLHTVQRYLAKEVAPGLRRVAASMAREGFRTADELHRRLVTLLRDHLVHHVEERRWIEPFWNDKRTVRMDGKEFEVPSDPKDEPAIQPTLGYVLTTLFAPLGVHVMRESAVGPGNLDFCCLYAAPEGTAMSVAIEFKLAHHSRLKHGISVQLPTYMKALDTRHGVFIVFWFQDVERKFFRNPGRATKEDLTDILRNEAAACVRNHGLTIVPIVIDASVKRAASHL